MSRSNEGTLFRPKLVLLGQLSPPFEVVVTTGMNRFRRYRVSHWGSGSVLVSFFLIFFMVYLTF